MDEDGYGEILIFAEITIGTHSCTVVDEDQMADDFVRAASTLTPSVVSQLATDCILEESRQGVPESGASTLVSDWSQLCGNVHRAYSLLARSSGKRMRMFMLFPLSRTSRRPTLD